MAIRGQEHDFIQKYQSFLNKKLLPGNSEVSYGSLCSRGQIILLLFGSKVHKKSKDPSDHWTSISSYKTCAVLIIYFFP